MTWSATAPIVVFGDDWGRNVSTMQHTFAQINPHRPVIWVNGIGHRVPTLRLADARRVVEKGARLFRKAAPSVVAHADAAPPTALIEPRVLPFHHWGAVHAFNTHSLVRDIRARLRALDLHEPPLLVIGSPPAVGVIGRIGEVASMYFCMDDFLHLPGVTTEMIAPLERRLLAQVDTVVVTARSLVRTKRPRSGNVEYLPQGVSYDHFAAPRPVPADVRDLPRPWIGFAGGLYDRVDQELLLMLADRVPGASIILVGPVYVDVARLARPNIHVVGPRPYRELPAYVRQFDVGIIPYVINEETIAVDPLKLLEYLAAGLPVVTTAIPEAAKYADALWIGRDREDFVNAVVAALGSDRSAMRRRGQMLAREHTWAGRARTFLQIAEQTVARRSMAARVAV